MRLVISAIHHCLFWPMELKKDMAEENNTAQMELTMMATGIMIEQMGLEG